VKEGGGDRPVTARHPFYRGRAGSRGWGVPALGVTRPEEGEGLASGQAAGSAGNGLMTAGA
jgi:hypothetical protein